MLISYATSDQCPGWGTAPAYIGNLVERFCSKHILEIGSGANPTLAADYVRKANLTYVTSDVDPEELLKADSVYESLLLDLTAPNIDPALRGKFDFVFSRMVNEHVKDGRTYHANILNILRPGGIAVHSFSTLWALPFAVNRLMPDALTDTLLRVFAPRDEHMHGKFKAYYSWGRGPTRSMISGFQELGYDVVEYVGYFGHKYYQKRLPILQKAEDIKSRFLVKYPVPELCSYATVILQKAEN